MLYIFTGLPYSGKTTLAKKLSEKLHFQRVSVDIIMDKMDMWREGHPTPEDWNTAYSKAYEELETLLKEGKDIIFDCGNLPFHERENARQIAMNANSPYKLIYVNTPKREILKRREKNLETKERGHLDDKMMDDAIALFDEPTENEHPIIYNQDMDLDYWIKENILT